MNKQAITLTAEQDNKIAQYIQECKSSITVHRPRSFLPNLYQCLKGITALDPLLKITIKCPSCNQDIIFKKGKRYKHDHFN